MRQIRKVLWLFAPVLGSLRNSHFLQVGVAFRENGQTKPIDFSGRHTDNIVEVAPGLLVAGREEILDGNLGSGSV